MNTNKRQAKEIRDWADAIAESTGRESKEVLKELIDKLKVILKKPYLKKLDDDAKIENAIRILKATNTKPLGKSGREFELLVLDKTSRHTIRPKDGGDPYERSDVMGFAICTDEKAMSKEKPVMWFNMVIFDEDDELIDSIEIGETLEDFVTYSVKCTGEVKGGKWELGSIDEVTRFVKSKEQMDGDVEKMLVDAFGEVIPISDAEYNLSKKKGDLKLMKGNVTYCAVKTSEKGYTYGRFVFIDDSIDVEDIKNHGGMSVMCDKAQVRWEEGSDLYFVGENEKDDEYGVGLTNPAIIPFIPIPREQEDEIDDIPDDPDEEYNEDEELDLGGDEAEIEEDEPEEEEPEEEDEPEEEPKPKSKPKKSASKPKKPKAKKVEEDDDDDDGGAIELGDD